MITTNQLVNYSARLFSTLPRRKNPSANALRLSLFVLLFSMVYLLTAARWKKHYVSPVQDVNPATATQIIILLLFIFGIFFALIMYCKTCSRSYQERYSEGRECRNERCERTEANSLHYYTVQESRDRPPSYSEACSAPPLYGSPFNRASMLEPPPVYPDTPKLSNGRRDQGLPVNCHM